MTDNASTVNELLSLTQRLLNSVVTADWKTYTSLCDSTITCFEPEARGQLVEGLPFHQFYFDITEAGRRQITVTQPHVRLLGPDANDTSRAVLKRQLDAVVARVGTLKKLDDIEKLTKRIRGRMKRY